MPGMEDLMVILRIAGLGFAVTLISSLLKKSGKDIEATCVGLIGAVICIIWVIEYITQFFEVVQTMFMF